jgi:hypothetical protein
LHITVIETAQLFCLPRPCFAAIAAWWERMARRFAYPQNAAIHGLAPHCASGDPPDAMFPGRHTTILIAGFENQPIWGYDCYGPPCRSKRNECLVGECAGVLHYKSSTCHGSVSACLAVRVAEISTASGASTREATLALSPTLCVRALRSKQDRRLQPVLAQKSIRSRSVVIRDRDNRSCSETRPFSESGHP